MDKLGHRRVLTVAAALHSVAVVTLTLSRITDPLLLHIGGLMAGAALPQFSGLMRSTWAQSLSDVGERDFALGAEAVVVEIMFLIGPAGVSALLFLLSPSQAMLALVACTAIGALGMSATLPSSSHRIARTGRFAALPLRSPGLRTLLAATLAFGVADGIAQVAVPAVAASLGFERLSGFLLAAVGVGSVAGGTLYVGLVREPARDFATAHLAMAALFVGVALSVPSTVGFAAVLLGVGLSASPIAITNSRLLERVTEKSEANEAFAWLIVAVAVGGAIGTAMAGLLVEHAHLWFPFLIAAGAAAAGGVAAALRRATLSDPL